MKSNRRTLLDIITGWLCPMAVLLTSTFTRPALEHNIQSLWYRIAHNPTIAFWVPLSLFGLGLAVSAFSCRASLHMADGRLITWYQYKSGEGRTSFYQKMSASAVAMNIAGIVILFFHL